MFTNRPRSNDITMSLLKRAKENGYKALVVTLDTMTIGWRPHDLETSYVPFQHGVGVQLGLSDPVFMARHGKQPVTDQHPEFPYDPAKFDQKIAAGDAKVQETMFLGTEWLKEIHVFRDWEELKFLRDNWEGPLVLKGISCTHVRFIPFLSLSNVPNL
jgi:lactate 2-monooxygenase